MAMATEVRREREGRGRERESLHIAYVNHVWVIEKIGH